MMAAEFLDWRTPDGSDRWELIDGIPRAMASPSDRHALIHSEALRLIGNHLVERRPDCRIGIGIGLRPNDYNVRIPDLAGACGPPAGFQAPRLVIEILSPSNVALYMTLRSVQEVLVLASEKIEAHVLRRPSWPRLTLTEGDDRVMLDCIGFSAPLAAFYRTVV
jgi:Uma2 family endonuclease